MNIASSMRQSKYDMYHVSYSLCLMSHVHFVSYYLLYLHCLILFVIFTLSHTTCHIHYIWYYLSYSLCLTLLGIFTISYTTCHIHFVSYYLSNSLCLILVICTVSCYTVTLYYNRPKSDINLTILDKNSMTFHFQGFTVDDLRQFEFDF